MAPLEYRDEEQQYMENLVDVLLEYVSTMAYELLA